MDTTALRRMHIVLLEGHSESFAIGKFGLWDGIIGDRLIKYEPSISTTSNLYHQILVSYLPGLVETRSYADSVSLKMFISREHLPVMFFYEFKVSLNVKDCF